MTDTVTGIGIGIENTNTTEKFTTTSTGGTIKMSTSTTSGVTTTTTTGSSNNNNNTSQGQGQSQNIREQHQHQQRAHSMPEREHGLGHNNPPGGTGGGGPGGTGGGGMREYCLRWNNHQPNLCNFFGTLLQRESFVDVTLVSSEGKQLHAHKLVLSACSPYFQHVFENNPCKHPVVILKDIHFSDLRTIISFVYNGEVNISQDRINSILATASTLQIKGLAEVPADELKRVGGPRGAPTHESGISNRSQPPPLQSSSSWASADGDDFPHGEIPRKKLKKSTSAAGPSGLSSMSTNGENSSAGGSFESGVGASMSRSMDDATSLGILEGSVRSPVSRPGPPALTPGAQLAQQQKSRSLDIGIEREVANIDSELSSGGFSENQTYDDSSLGADRGFELEIADVKIEAVSDDGEIEFDEEESFDHPDNPDFEPNQTFPNYPSSSSLFHQPSRHFGSSVVGGKGRRGRLLIRQPRIKRLDNEPGRNGAELNLVEEGSGGSEDTTIVTSASGSQSRDDGTPGDEAFSFSPSSFTRQQSIVPIVTVSESSPTPPSSPSPQPSQIIIKDVTAIRHTSFSSASGGSSGSSRLLMIPSSSEPEIFRGHSSSSNTLVKQLSQPHLPSQTSSSSVGLPRQHSNPTPPSSMQGTSTRLVYSGVKPGDLFQIVPTDRFRGGKGEEQDGSFLVDSSSILQIIPAGEGNSGNRVAFASKGSLKEVEIFRRDIKRDPLEAGGSFESMLPSDDSAQGEHLSLDDTDLKSMQPLQRSGHCPALRPGPALGCNFCWNSVDKCGRILRRKTKYHCPECHINLCIVPCFQEYHEKADKKKTKGSKLLLPKPSSM